MGEVSNLQCIAYPRSIFHVNFAITIAGAILGGVKLLYYACVRGRLFTLLVARMRTPHYFRAGVHMENTLLGHYFPLPSTNSLF